MDGRLTSPVPACRPVYRLPAAPRKWSTRACSVRRTKAGTNSADEGGDEYQQRARRAIDIGRRQYRSGLSALKNDFVIEAGILIYKHGAPELRISMIARRTLILTGMAGLLTNAWSHPALAEPPAPNDPLVIVNAIYARAGKGKGDGGGGFVIENKTAKARYLSKALIALWAKADAHTPKGSPRSWTPTGRSSR
jgi:hypothetical protein